MLLGAHMSIAGGLHLAIERALKTGCDAVQIFTKNNTRWRSKPLSDADIKLFMSAWEKSGIPVIFAHNSYLINLASPDPVIHKKSVEAMIDEVERAEKLGLPWIVIHPGAHKGEGESQGLKRIAKSLDTVLKATKGFRTGIALENTSGSGSLLGFRFSHHAQIIESVKNPERIFICYDTCHAFSAGYDISSKEGYEATFDELRGKTGPDRLVCIHINDSLKDLGSRADRHEHIGKGKIGLQAFRLLMNDAHLKNTPMVLETPKGEGYRLDRENLRILKGLKKNSKEK